jgi:putative lipoic acid-binding regulatory protein
MQQQDPPKIEFPCEYPIKVLGRSVPEFETVVVDVIERHSPGFSRETISLRASREGTFVSMTVFITATGKEQLQALHEDLMETGLVQMVI